MQEPAVGPSTAVTSASASVSGATGARSQSYRPAETDDYACHPRLQRDLTGRVLDMVAFAVIVVDALGMLHYANEAGEALLEQPHGALTVARGRVRTRQTAKLNEFRQLLAGAAARPAAIGPSRMLLSSPGADEARLSVHISPLSGSYRPHETEILIAARPLVTLQTLTGASRQIFGLTEAEAQIAAALANGISLADAAQEQGIRISTARTHMMHIFEKMGVRKQSQVAALLRSIEMPLISRP